MKKILCAVWAIAVSLCMAADGRSVAEKLKADLLAIGASPNYYWAWTHTWCDPWPWYGDTKYAVKTDDGYTPKPLADVKLASCYQQYADGRMAVINYSDLAMVAGTWHPPIYYSASRATLTAAIKKQWAEFGGVMVFSWHMDHPYCTNRFPAASYRFKSEGKNRNVIKQILDGTGDPCGTGSIDKITCRKPHPNPRAWFMTSLKEVASFLNGLVDEKTGKKIPVIVRYPHEMDGSWFWWGRTWCTADEFRQFCRMIADYLRKECPGQIVFAYTPDRTWSEFGREGDSDNTFMAYYPGDKYVDMIGIDDYSIGHGDDKKVEKNFNETVRKLRLLTAFAKPRGQVVCISESGGKKKRSDFWTWLHRAATADGVNCAFVNTWSRGWGTIPETDIEAADQKKFASHPAVLMDSSNCGFRTK